MQQLHSLQVFSGAMDAVAFSPDGTRLASGGRDNTIRVWDAETGEQLMRTEGHTDWVTTVTFSPNGIQIISGSRDNTVRVFNADTGALMANIGGHDDDVNAVAVTPDGSVIASGGRDGQIKLWDMITGDLIQTLDQFDEPVWQLAFDPSGTYLASTSETGTIWLWGLWGDNSGWLKQLVGHQDPVPAIAFAPDGQSLVSGGLDGMLHVWDLSDLDMHTFAPDISASGHLAPIMGVGMSADMKVAISASLDGSVRLWDIGGVIEVGRELSVMRGNGSPLTNLTLDPQQARAASVGTDGVLNLWDMGTETIASIIDDNQTLALAATTQEPAAPVVPSIDQTPPLANGRGISIPSANIRENIKTFPLDGVSWAIDPWEPIVGHFQGTAWINQTGNVVLGGHSEMPDGSAGIFNSLYNVGIGDEIFVQDGPVTRRYVVVNILSVDYRDLSVVYPTTFNRLTLITCDIPSYVAEQNIYYERLVIVADEVPL